MKKYIINEETFTNLLRDHHLLAALIDGGIQEWEVLKDCIRNYENKLGKSIREISPEDLEGIEKVDFHE